MTEGPSDTLGTLKELDQVLQDLRAVLIGRGDSDGISDEEEERFGELVAKAQVLYGSVEKLVGTAVIVRGDRRYEAFQSLLSQASLSRIFNPYSTADLWDLFWQAARSNVRQAIGRLEGTVTSRGQALPPDTMLRWSWLIRPLEAIRSALLSSAGWLASRPSILESLLQRIEGSPIYRIAKILINFGAVIGLFLVVASYLGVASLFSLPPFDEEGAPGGSVVSPTATEVSVPTGVSDISPTPCSNGSTPEVNGVVLACVLLTAAELTEAIPRDFTLRATYYEGGVSRLVAEDEAATSVLGIIDSYATGYCASYTGYLRPKACVFLYGTANDARTAFARFEAVRPSPEITTEFNTAGVGDEAIGRETREISTAVSVTFRVGRTLAQVNTHGIPGDIDATLEAAQALAFKMNSLLNE